MKLAAAIRKHKHIKPSECILLKLYGDGIKFTEPVWYSCGNCDKCERIPKKI